MEKLIFIAAYLIICVWYYKNAKDFGTEPTVDLSQLKLDTWKAEQKRRVEILRRGCKVAGDLNAFAQESVLTFNFSSPWENLTHLKERHILRKITRTPRKSTKFRRRSLDS